MHMICYYLEDINAVAKCSSVTAKVFFIFDSAKGWRRDEWGILLNYLNGNGPIRTITEKEMKEQIKNSGYSFDLDRYLSKAGISDEDSFEDVVEEIARRSHSAITKGIARDLVNALISDMKTRSFILEAPSMECRLLIILMAIRKHYGNRADLIEAVENMQKELDLSDEDISYYTGMEKRTSGRQEDETTAKAMEAMARGDFPLAKEILEEKIRELTGKYVNNSKTEYRNLSEPMDALMYTDLFNPGREVIWIDEPIGKYYQLLGSVLIEMQDPRSAKAALANARLWKPTSLDPIFEYMEALKALGEFTSYGELAEKSFRYAYRAETFARCLRNLGFYFIECENYDAAIICFTISLKWEDTQAARQELDYIEHVSGEPIPDMSNEKVEEIANQYSIPLKPDKNVIRLVCNVLQNHESKEDQLYHYFQGILRELTGDGDRINLDEAVRDKEESHE